MNYHKLLLTTVIAAAHWSSASYALDVTSTFSAGDTLTADKMNEIKDAVNSKQDRVTGVCSSGSAISAINADGTVSCETDSDTQYTGGNGIDISGTTIRLGSGSSSIAHSAFTTPFPHAGCTFVRYLNGSYFYDGDYCGTQDGGLAYAPIQILNGVTINSVSCNIYDNTALGEITEVSLYANRVSSAVAGVNIIADSDGSDTGSTGPSGLSTAIDAFQRVGDLDVVHTVDNSTFAYFIAVQFTHTAASTFTDTGADLYVSGCRIDYTP